ncbi:MAG TPA: hypothetical protein VEU54_13010 [Steroidobacteraceae bacterium]|jgi:hypothetical protein|nr:hypothetical protein [Steroidobacteraceae bacterium]
MKRISWALSLLAAAIACAAAASRAEGQPAGHYLFAWAGDVEKKGNDFLAVIDADPKSASYGHLVTTVVTDQRTMQVHHTEYAMPASGFLFANDHLAGRTFIIDVRDPLHPKVSTSFVDLAGYSHPHSFLRLPNGHVLASFQHMHHEGAAMQMAYTGGLVEIDDAGQVIRAASSADPAHPDALLMPYSLVVLPEIDRVLVTNSSMHLISAHGNTYQIYRLSDLKLLETEHLDRGRGDYGELDPEEPRRGPDGSVYIQTLGCGIERVTSLDTTTPHSKLVYRFPGSMCGVPTIVGHYLIQTVPSLHGVVVLDIARPRQPVEVSTLRIDDRFWPHWTGWDAKTGRLVVTGYDVNRLFVLELDPATGAVSLDTAFHDADGKPGFSFDDRAWPHGWQGSANPHGVVFSR